MPLGSPRSRFCGSGAQPFVYPESPWCQRCSQPLPASSLPCTLPVWAAGSEPAGSLMKSKISSQDMGPRAAAPESRGSPPPAAEPVGWTAWGTRVAVGAKASNAVRRAPSHRVTQTHVYEHAHTFTLSRTQFCHQRTRFPVLAPKQRIPPPPLLPA